MSEYPEDKTLVAPLREQKEEGVVILETADGKHFSVRDGDVAGRAEIGRDVLEPYVEVSRRQAQFLCRGEHWFVIDLKSSNGTFIDGQKIAPNRPTPFADGQRIGFSAVLGLTARIVKPAPVKTTIVTEPVDPNRRTLVILFADVKGSVDFFQERGTIIGKNWIFKLFRMLTAIIEEHGGTHLKDIGDAMLAIFDDPHPAAMAAVKMQQVIREYNLAADASERYYLRIGMNMGSVLFENNDIFGNAVNIASRVQDIAPPERIYITGTLRQNLGQADQLQVRPVGRKQLKGVKSTTEIFEILPAGHSESAPPALP